MLVIKFVTIDFRSPGPFGHMDYSAPWPKVVRAGNITEGLHVIRVTDCVRFSEVPVAPQVIVGFVDDVDVISAISEDEDKLRIHRMVVLGTLADFPDVSTKLLTSPAYLAQLEAIKANISN